MLSFGGEERKDMEPENNISSEEPPFRNFAWLKKILSKLSLIFAVTWILAGAGVCYLGVDHFRSKLKSFRQYTTNDRELSSISSLFDGSQDSLILLQSMESSDNPYIRRELREGVNAFLVEQAQNSGVLEIKTCNNFKDCPTGGIGKPNSVYIQSQLIEPVSGVSSYLLDVIATRPDQNSVEEHLYQVEFDSTESKILRTVPLSLGGPNGSTVKLTIKSTPSGANFTIDSRSTGLTTDCDYKVFPSKETSFLTLEKEGYSICRYPLKFSNVYAAHVLDCRLTKAIREGEVGSCTCKLTF